MNILWKILFRKSRNLKDISFVLLASKFQYERGACRANIAPVQSSLSYVLFISKSDFLCTVNLVYIYDILIRYSKVQ